MTENPCNIQSLAFVVSPLPRVLSCELIKYASDENGVRRGNVYLVKIGEKSVEDGSKDICKDKESNLGPVAGYRTKAVRNYPE